MTKQQTTVNRGWRERLYHFIDNEEEQNLGSQLFEVFITILILISIISIILESFESLREGIYAYMYLPDVEKGILAVQRAKIIPGYGSYFDLFENVTLLIFALEYVCRVITADYKYKSETSLWVASFRFIKSNSGIVDLIAISPLIFVLSDIDFRFIRVLKISRLFRVFKLSTLTHSIVIVGDVFVEKAGELGITMFVTFVLLLVSATLMWYVEGGAQPDSFPNIVATFWWAIATLTTVGYGDVYPITAGGKVLSGIIAILGIGMVALPAGILSSAFIEKLETSQEGTGEEPEKAVAQNVSDSTEASKCTEAEQSSSNSYRTHLLNSSKCMDKIGTAFKYCPYCGKKLDDHDCEHA